MSGSPPSAWREMRGYGFGYVLAVVLTCLAFVGAAVEPFPRRTTVGIVFGLGFLQMIVHFRYFLHISFKKSSRDDLLLILFAVLIVVLMVGGSLTVLLNLRHRMM